MKRRCIAAFSNICKLLRSPLVRLAVRSTPSSVWEKAFIVVRFSRNLVSFHNYCHPPRLFSEPNHRTRGSGQRSWTQGWQSQTEGESKKRTEESLLSSGRFKLSPATGGGWPGPLPVLFKQLSRHIPVLCYFPCTPRAAALRQARVSGGNLQNCAPSAACGGAMTEESNVPLRSLRPPASLLFAIKKAKLLLRRNIAIRVSLFHPEAGLAAVH